MRKRDRVMRNTKIYAINSRSIVQVCSGLCYLVSGYAYDQLPVILPNAVWRPHDHSVIYDQSVNHGPTTRQSESLTTTVWYGGDTYTTIRRRGARRRRKNPRRHWNDLTRYAMIHLLANIIHAFITRDCIKVIMFVRCRGLVFSSIY